MAVERDPGATRQQLETIVEPLGDILYRHRRDARCRELDGEWNSIQPLADLRHGRGVAGVEWKIGLHLEDAVDQQFHRPALEDMLRVGLSQRIGHRE